MIFFAARSKRIGGKAKDNPRGPGRNEVIMPACFGGCTVSLHFFH